VVVINQLATKLFTAENEHGNFNNGDKAILMPQLGEHPMRHLVKADAAGELWTTAKTIRLVLFRGPPGNELRYAHASTSSDGSLGTKWACFDIDVRHHARCRADRRSLMGYRSICQNKNLHSHASHFMIAVNIRRVGRHSCRTP
jgi:hypothetical protein